MEPFVIRAGFPRPTSLGAGQRMRFGKLVQLAAASERLDVVRHRVEQDLALIETVLRLHLPQFSIY